MRPAVFFSEVDVPLRAAPIRPDWIVAGTPVARNADLSQGRTQNSMTLVWDCTAGTFDWHYDTDEVVHILEGGVLLSQDGGPVRRVGPGEVVFFPAGSTARWTVESYVRKLAFFSGKLPRPVALGLAALRRAKGAVRRRGRELAVAPAPAAAA